METSEINQLRQLDEQERLAWANYIETKSMTSLETISKCAKEKARIYGAAWPDAPTVKVIKKGKAQ